MPSLPLTAHESVILRTYGRFSVTYFVPLVTETMLWGLYMMVILLSSYLLYRQGIRGSRPRLILLVVTVFMFVASTAILGLTIYVYLIRVKAISFMDTIEGQSYSDKRAKSQFSTDRALFSSAVLFCFELLLGDAIVVWRACALWQHKRRLISIPIGLWIGAMGTYIGWVSCELADFDGVPAGYPEKPAYKLQLAQGVLSVAANIASTILIMYRAWQFRRSILRSKSPSETTRVERILALLIESGLVYLLAAAAKMMVFTNPNYGPGLIIVLVFDYCANQLVGLYPTVIIVLVQLQRTVWDSPDVSELLFSTLQASDPEAHSRSLDGTLSFGPASNSELMLSGDRTLDSNDKPVPLGPLEPRRQ